MLSDRAENHYSMMNRIMLTFRPIVPKPDGGEQLPAERKHGRRTKRKYVRVRGRQSAKRKPTKEGRPSPPEKSGVHDGLPPDKAVATLQLLPERSESENSCCYSSSTAQKSQDIIDRDQRQVGDEVINYESDAVAYGGGTTRIVVECVTDTYVDSGVGFGFSDEEIIKNLQADTCPGFVSDGANNVVWVNDACRRMEAENGVLVVIMRGKLPYFTPSFACRVRMIQQTKHGQKRNRIVACDVWRMMKFAGFAWKLDVQTALGLGI